MASAQDNDGQEVSREALADSPFEHYDFGDGVQVLSHDRWDSSDPDDWVKRVYVCYEEDEPEDSGMRYCCYCGATLVTPNVELTGAAQPHRAASGDRRERG